MRMKNLKVVVMMKRMGVDDWGLMMKMKSLNGIVKKEMKADDASNRRLCRAE
jgi:hypothetical protein